MTSDPLLPILHATAQLLLSRPGLAGQRHSPERFVVEHRQLITGALLKSPVLRNKIRNGVRARRDEPDLQAAMTLILAADEETVRAGLRLLDQLAKEKTSRQTLRSRQQQRLSEFRNRLEIAKGRAEHSGMALQAADTALSDVTQRAEELETEVAALQRRLHDPRILASNLLTALQRSSDSPQEGPEARDPRNLRPRQQESPAPPAAVAADAAGITQEALIAALQAIITPPAPVAEIPRVTVGRNRSLTVRPLGGAAEIGGSCLLVEAGGTRLLIDAGLRPGDPALPPRNIDEALSAEIQAVVVTHAHTDHCGYVPALVEQRPGLRVIATPETTYLMPRMWADSAKLMTERERLHRRWGTDSPVLYQRAAVETAARRCEEVPFGVVREIGGVRVELFPAGHILGAAGVVIQAGDRRVVVTGDISGFRQETVDGYAIPDSAREPDLLIMESTCCGEDHDPRETRIKDLVRGIEEVYAAGGRVLIPAFALGRAQELALVIRAHLPHVPVLLDGMAAHVALSFEQVTADGTGPLRIFGGNVGRARRPESLGHFTSGVVITTSGMLTGGPAIEWASRILPEPRSALFLSGYQDEESNGARLLRLVEERASHLFLIDHGVEKQVPLKARVEMMRLSAHADKRGLLDIADEVAPDEIMLVHGLAHRQRDFAKVLGVRHHRPVPTRRWSAGGATGA